MDKDIKTSVHYRKFISKADSVLLGKEEVGVLTEEIISGARIGHRTLKSLSKVLDLLFHIRKLNLSASQVQARESTFDALTLRRNRLIDRYARKRIRHLRKQMKGITFRETDNKWREPNHVAEKLELIQLARDANLIDVFVVVLSNASEEEAADVRYALNAILSSAFFDLKDTKFSENVLEKLIIALSSAPAWKTKLVNECIQPFRVMQEASSTTNM